MFSTCLCLRFFFFQAEDGIRDESVTGVQTCALPIDRKSTRLNSSHTLILCRIIRSEEHTSELQSHSHLVCRLLLEKKKERADKLGGAITVLHDNDHAGARVLHT